MSQGETKESGESGAVVEVVESMGSEAHQYLSLEERSIVAKMDGTAPVRVGDRVRLAFDKERSRLIDPETEEAILPQPALATA